MTNDLLIGQVARKAGVNIQTIRYYERRGFIRPASRRASGYRLYGSESVQRVLFIKRAQDLGFSLKVAAGLLQLKADGTSRQASVRRKAQSHLVEVRQRIAHLRSIERALSRLVRACLKKGPADPCPILEGLNS